MGTPSATELTAKVKDTIIRVLDLHIDRAQLADHVSLYSSVIQMDSLTLLHLLVTFEKEFDIEIDDEDVMNSNLKDVRSLIELVGALAGKGDVEAESSQTNGVGARDGRS